MKKIFFTLALCLTVALTGALFTACGSKREMIDVYKQYPNLLIGLDKENTGFNKDASAFEEIDKGNKKILDINLVYENKVLIVGIVKNIRNNLKNTFKNKYNEIDLTILQKNPKDVYDCKYINGNWDKEVN